MYGGLLHLQSKAKIKTEVFYILKYDFKKVKYYLNSVILFYV